MNVLVAFRPETWTEPAHLYIRNCGTEDFFVTSAFGRIMHLEPGETETVLGLENIAALAGVAIE